MKRLLEDIRPIALVGIASGTSLSLLWFLLLLLDQFASRFALSDKVDGLYHLLQSIIVVQWLFMLILIWSLERARAKPPRPEDAEQTKGPEPGTNALVASQGLVPPVR